MQIRCAWEDTCHICGDNLEAGTVVVWDPNVRGQASHVECAGEPLGKRKGWKNYNVETCSVCGTRLKAKEGERWQCRSPHRTADVKNGHCEHLRYHYACLNVARCQASRVEQIENEQLQSLSKKVYEGLGPLQAPKFENLKEVQGLEAKLLGFINPVVIETEDVPDRRIWVLFEVKDIGEANILFHGCPWMGKCLPWNTETEEALRETCTPFAQPSVAKACPND